MDIDSPSFNKANSSNRLSLVDDSIDMDINMDVINSPVPKGKKTPVNVPDDNNLTQRPQIHRRSNSLKRPFSLSPHQNSVYSNIGLTHNNAKGNDTNVPSNFNNLAADFSQKFNFNRSNPKKNLMVNNEEFLNDENKENSNLSTNKFFNLNDNSVIDLHANHRKSFSMNNIRMRPTKYLPSNSSNSSFSSTTSNSSSNSFNAHSRSFSSSNSSFNSLNNSATSNNSSQSSINSSNNSSKNHLRSKSSTLMTSFAFKSKLPADNNNNNSNQSNFNIFEDSFANQNNIFSMTPRSRENVSLDMFAVPTPNKETSSHIQSQESENDNVSPETKSVLNKSVETLTAQTSNSKSNLELLKSFSHNNRSNSSFSNSLYESDNDDEEEEDVIDKLNRSNMIYKNSNSTSNLIPIKKSIYSIDPLGLNVEEEDDDEFNNNHNDTNDALDGLVEEDDEEEKDLSQGSIGSPLQKKQTFNINRINLFKSKAGHGGDLSTKLQRTTSMVDPSFSASSVENGIKLPNSSLNHFQMPLPQINKNNLSRNLRIKPELANRSFLNRSTTSLNATNQITSNINGLSFNSPVEFSSLDNQSNDFGGNNTSLLKSKFKFGDNLKKKNMSECNSSHALKFSHSTMDSTLSFGKSDGSSKSAVDSFDLNSNSNGGKERECQDDEGRYNNHGNLILPKTHIKTFKVDNCTLPRIKVTEFYEILKDYKESKRNNPDKLFYNYFEELVIIDCRFEYEFKGGHIEGAINVSSKKELEQYLFPTNPENQEIELLNHTPVDFTKTKRKLIIFHCEFSSHRGPLMANNLRNWDRFINKDHYPNLYYPDIVILEGGYKKFFEIGNDYCFPKRYIEMDDPNFKDDCERELDKLRKDSKINLNKRTNRLGRSFTTNNVITNTHSSIQNRSPNSLFRTNSSSIFGNFSKNGNDKIRNDDNLFKADKFRLNSCSSPNLPMDKNKILFNIKPNKSLDVLPIVGNKDNFSFEFSSKSTKKTKSDELDDGSPSEDGLDFFYNESPVITRTANLNLSNTNSLLQLNNAKISNDVSIHTNELTHYDNEDGIFKQPMAVTSSSKSKQMGNHSNYNKYKSLHFRSKTMASIPFGVKSSNGSNNNSNGNVFHKRVPSIPFPHINNSGPAGDSSIPLPKSSTGGLFNITKAHTSNNNNTLSSDSGNHETTGLATKLKSPSVDFFSFITKNNNDRNVAAAEQDTTNDEN